MADRLVDYIRTLIPDIADAPVFIADAVAEQLDAIPDLGPDWTFPAEWYGKLAPPFPYFWVEADTWATGTGGALTRHQRLSLVADLTPSLHGIEGIEERILPGTEWVMGFWGFARVGLSRQVIHYSGNTIICVAKDGRMLTDPAHAVIALSNDHDRGRGLFHHPLFMVLEPMPGDGREGILNHSPFTWRTVGLLHERCETLEVIPTRQQRRHFQREHDTELEPLAHHVLKVKPYTPRPDNPLKGLAKPEKTPGRRKHDVRATWAYYSPDKPLFGRPGLTGMFRRKSHERGDDQLGRIIKTYRVEPQEGEP